MNEVANNKGQATYDFLYFFTVMSLNFIKWIIVNTFSIIIGCMKLFNSKKTKSCQTNNKHVMIYYYVLI